MEVINTLYWLQGYLSVDCDMDVVKSKINEAIAEYEENKNVIANSAATLMPFPNYYGDSIKLPDNVRFADGILQAAQPYGEIVN